MAKGLQHSFPYGRCKKCGEGLWSDGECRNCEEFRRQKAERELKMIEQMGSERAFRLYTLAKYKTTPANKMVLECCKDFNHMRDNIFLYGPSGRGKSHLAAIAKVRMIGKGVLVMTKTMDEILSSLREAIRSASAQGELIAMLIRVPVLNIEDLGAEKITEFSLNTLYQIVDGRYKAVRNGLIITSNLSLEWIAAEHTNERVTSRLSEMCKSKVFDMKDELDWRRA